MEGYLAEIRMFAAPFAPRAWAYCAGQILSIAQNQALFSLLGTTFGGNGINTFALPDLRSRVAIGTGSGAGLNISLGEMAGTPTTTLIVTQLPAHNHVATAVNTVSGNVSVAPLTATGKSVTPSNSPINTYPGTSSAGTAYGTPASTNTMAKNDIDLSGVHVGTNLQIGITGSNQPVSIMQPYLAMNYIICTAGIFPSRN